MSSVEKIPEGTFSRSLAMLLVIFVTLSTLIRSVVSQVTNRFHHSLFSDSASDVPNLTDESLPKEEFRPPSPAPAPAFTKKDLLSSALKKLGELEEKVDMLQAKPFEMPYEKEELLNAAVYRVDALEAELIATKKVTLSHLILSYLMETTYELLCLFSFPYSCYRRILSAIRLHDIDKD